MKTSNSLSIAENLFSLLRKCNSTKPLQQIHTQMLLHSIHKPNVFLHKLIHLRDFNYSLIFFTHIPYPNDYTFNIMIRALTNTWDKSNLALQFYYKMKSLGIKPDNYTYPFVFISCANLSEIRHGILAHCMVVKSGLCVDFHVMNSLITMYSRFRLSGLARKVFDEMEIRDLVSWNAMISGYSKMGFAREARELFKQMRNKGFEPDEMSLVTVLGACGDLGDLSLGKWIEGYIIGKVMELTTFIGSALIDMYGKCGDLVSAKRVFNSIGKKDRVIWNALITGCAQNGLSDEAISLFNTMKGSGIKPDKITLIVVLSACASVGSLDVGKSINEYALNQGLENDVYVATALVDMYAKCGSVDHAFQMFEKMPHKNEVSWNAMISALAFHGRPKEALLLFDRMLQEGGPTSYPNEITFIAVLSACVHVGLVDEGKKLFNLMSKPCFNLVPKIEHYSCMVDLLSRAGKVYEAWDFIKKMPKKPDEVLLGSLLGACERLKNIDIGERVIKLLLELEPSNSGNYVLSSKIYANMKRWDDSAKMIVLMKEKGVTKTPGCSWIEIDSQIVEFRAGDMLHLDTHEIYHVLDILYDEMSKMEGYILPKARDTCIKIQE